MVSSLRWSLCKHVLSSQKFVSLFSPEKLFKLLLFWRWSDWSFDSFRHLSRVPLLGIVSAKQHIRVGPVELRVTTVLSAVIIMRLPNMCCNWLLSSAAHKQPIQVLVLYPKGTLFFNKQMSGVSAVVGQLIKLPVL